MEDRVLKTLRIMAFQRAKGELISMLETFYGDTNKFDLLNKAVDDFIENVESNELHS